MGGPMSGSQFGVKVGWRVGNFLALTIGFPLIVHGLAVATGARDLDQVTIFAGVLLKPVIILGFVLSLLSPCWRRMRSLGFPGFVGLLAPFLFLLDWHYFMVAGAAWGVGLSADIQKLTVPLFAMSALAMLVAMSVASPPDDRSPSQRMAGRIGGALAIVLFAVALPTGGAASIWFMSPGDTLAPFILPAKQFHWALLIKPFVCAAFCAAMAVMVYLSQKESSGPSPRGSETGGGPVMPSPPAVAPGSSRVGFGRR